MGRKKTTKVGGHSDFTRKFRAGGKMVSYFSHPKYNLFKKKKDAKGNAELYRITKNYGLARITKEKDGYRVWARKRIKQRRRK